MNEQSAIPRTRGSLENLDNSHAILTASSIKVTGRMSYSVASFGPVTVVPESMNVSFVVVGL